GLRGPGPTDQGAPSRRTAPLHLVRGRPEAALAGKPLVGDRAYGAHPSRAIPASSSSVRPSLRSSAAARLRRTSSGSARSGLAFLDRDLVHLDRRLRPITGA